MSDQEKEEWGEEDFPIVCCCCSCDRPKRCKWVPDPYIAEIHPEQYNPPDAWCFKCYQERSDEV